MKNPLSDQTERTIQMRDMDALLDALLRICTTIRTALFHDRSLDLGRLDGDQVKNRANQSFGKKSGSQISDVRSVKIPAAICQPLDEYFDGLRGQSIMLTGVHFGMPFTTEPCEGIRIAAWSDGVRTETYDILAQEARSVDGPDDFQFIGVIPCDLLDIPFNPNSISGAAAQVLGSIRSLVAETSKVCGITSDFRAMPEDDEAMDVLDNEIARQLGTQRQA
jgi:hypothetical protein